MINFTLALFLSVFHVFSGKLKFITYIPRSIWLSIGGGVSTAYVFLHLIPELAAGEELFESNNTYLFALAGLVTFYGLEKYVKSAKKDRKREQDSFWVHIASYTIYNFIIGYILVLEFSGSELYFFTLAMAFHFLVNDYSLRHHHGNLYDQKGRWVISIAIAAGAGLALLTEISHHVIAGATSFIGGAVIMNTLKEELPEERNSRFWAFVAGVVGYSVILMLWDWFGN